MSEKMRTAPLRHRHARAKSRRHRAIVYLTAAISGVGGTSWWLARMRDGGLGLTGLRVPGSAVGWCLIGLAGWGALLLLGELTLFVLAIMNVGDPEVHDRCRNLMILWGYVLTLGTSRFFRMLPAQFAQLFTDEDAPPARPAPGRRDARRRNRTTPPND